MHKDPQSSNFPKAHRFLSHLDKATHPFPQSFDVSHEGISRNLLTSKSVRDRFFWNRCNQRNNAIFLIRSDLELWFLQNYESDFFHQNLNRHIYIWREVSNESSICFLLHNPGITQNQKESGNETKSYKLVKNMWFSFGKGIQKTCEIRTNLTIVE